MFPSPNGANGRGPGGRFAKGNVGGPGNPNARHVARLRSALLKAVKPNDLKEVIAALLQSAKRGEVAAARELLQRLLGPAESIDLLARLDALERQADELARRASS
jgi:hypothetical protein